MKRVVALVLLGLAVLSPAPAPAFSPPQKAAIVSVGYLTQSRAIFAAYTTPPSQARKAAINTLVRSLVDSGVWDRLDGLYVLAAADSQAALINLKRPGTYDLTATNGPSFTADRGFTGANTKYLNTNFNPTTAQSPNFTQDNASAFLWDLSTAANSSSAFGGVAAAVHELVPRFTDNRAYGLINAPFVGGNGVNFAVADASGLTLIDRASSAVQELFKNGATLGTNSVASTTPTNTNLTFLASPGRGEYSTDQLAVAGFGASLSAAQTAALYIALHAYLQTVGATS